MYKVKVDEKNKVVIASKDGMEQDLYDSLYKRNLDPIYIGHKLDRVIEMPEKLSAKSRCCDLDTFDAEVGRKIAKDKFKAKYKALCVKRLDKAIDRLKKYITELENFRDKYYKN